MRCTVFEIEMMMDAETRRRNAARHQEAIWVACLMNATGNFKEPITVDSLIKPDAQTKRVEMVRIQQRAEERRRERLRQRGLVP